MSEEKKEGAEETAAKPKSKKKLFIIVGVVVLLLGAGIPVLFLGGGEKEAKDPHAAEEEEVKNYATITLDTFIVNLSANSAFLKVGMILEYDPAVFERAGAHGEGGGEGHGGGASGGGEEGAAGAAMPHLFAERQPMIKDAILRVLSSKKAEEVLTVDGKEKLKEELMEGINEAIGLDEEPIVNIYFTEFMVQ